MDGIRELIAQIRAASNTNFYFLALFGVLALPDICGALASDDGRTSPSKYKSWLKDNVPEQASSAGLIYGLRCSLLHQGRAYPHGGVFPMAFTTPLTGGIHNLSIEVNGERVGCAHIPTLVEEITRGAETWLGEFGSTDRVGRNLEKFARLRMEGIPPHIGGPVFA